MRFELTAEGGVMDSIVRWLGSGVLWVVLTGSTATAQSPLDAAGSLRDNLKAIHEGGKGVVVVLKNGDKYTARVGAVGERAVVLTEPHGKEFFDVYVPYDEIAALEARARTQ